MRRGLHGLIERPGKKAWLFLVLGVAATLMLGGGAYAAFGINVFAPNSGRSNVGINRQYWTGVGGTAISDLTGVAGYPDNPTGSDVLPDFNATYWANPAVTHDYAESYGQRASGYIVAPETGTYYFWISTDDNGELWLSTDTSSANEARIAYVAGWSSYQQWTKEANQASIGVNLVKGRYYFVEALQKEGAGGDNLSVGWRKPSDGAGASPTEVIPGSALATSLPGNKITAASGEKGLAGQWKLAGNAKDSSPYRNHGTYGGGNAVAADRKGAVGGATSFNGSSSSIMNLGNPANLNITGNLTITAWVKLTDNSNFGPLISKGPSDYELAADFRSGNNDALAWRSNGTGTTTNFANYFTGQAGVWTHVAVTVSGTTLTAYRNGQSFGSLTIPALSSTSANVIIGGRSATYFLTGSMQDLRVYNRALGGSEITALYSSYNSQINLNSNPTSSAATGNINQGLVGYWNFNGNAKDSTPYRNNGTVTGAVLTTDRKGRANSAYNFNGAGNYIDAGMSPITGTSPFTLAAWIKTTQTSNYSGAISIGASGSSQSAYIGTVAGAQNGTNSSIGGGFYGYNIGSGVNTTNQWVHVALTFAGGSNGTVIIYVNGTATNTLAYTPALTNTYMRFGRIGSDTIYDFSGALDDIRVYNRALSGTEVQTLYSAAN